MKNEKEIIVCFESIRYCWYCIRLDGKL